MYFRFINAKYGSEIGTILLHGEDDKNNNDKLKLKIAHTFNLKANQIILKQEKDFVIVHS
jgi:hypothetical protein